MDLEQFEHFIDWKKYIVRPNLINRHLFETLLFALEFERSDLTGKQAMAGGFAKDGAVQEQIDATVEDVIKHARDRLPRGDSLKSCEECGKEIPDRRRIAVPGVRLCVVCQTKHDAEQKLFSGYNRRGGQDSQSRRKISLWSWVSAASGAS